MRGSGKRIAIEHIRSPVHGQGKQPAPLQDSISIIFKNKVYEK